MYLRGNDPRKMQLELSITNCDKRCLDFMQSTWGGTVRVTRHEKKKGGRRYTVGIWQVSGQKAEDFARAIVPYTILKTDQLNLFIQARELVFPRGTCKELPKKNVSLRVSLVEACKRLKRPQWVEA